MKRNATLNLKGLDPDVLDAARDVARRAGVPLETWIASVVEAEDKPPARRRRRSVQPAAGRTPAPSQPPVPSAAGISHERIPAEAASSSEPAPLPESGALPEETTPTQAADPFAASIAQMLKRLDLIDEKIDETHRAAQDAATGKVAGIEAKFSTVLDGGLPPATELSERLATIERRMTELGEQLAQPRPLGRRGRPVAVEVSDAVGEIRQRQRELEDGDGSTGVVAALQQNVAAGMAAAFQPAPSSVIDDLRVETSRLRDCIGGLATGQDVNALEQAMLSLAVGVRQAQKPADLAGIVEPIERIQIQVSRLADDVAENVHARVAGDVERLAARFDRTLSAGPAGHADRDALGGLFGEIEEIRRLIAALAGPERIQSLAHGLQALSAQIAKLHDGAEQYATRMADLCPLLEEIRSEIKAPKADGIAQQIQAMGRKLDALHDQSSEGAGSEAIIVRIDALSDKVDRVGVAPVGETLRQPASAGGDLATIHSMLHDLVDKVDRVGGGSGQSADGLDALEKQVLALSRRIETRDADPAIAGLERSMNDLLAQVAAPVAKDADRDEIGSLRAGLSDLRTQQAASEQRMQATLNGVHAALDRLATHFGGAAVTPPKPPSARASSEPAVGAGRQPATGRRPEVLRAPSATPETSAEWSRAKDEILEPGAARPIRSRLGAKPDAFEPDAAPASTSEIKSNFIAAARRAALAAQAEAAETSPKASPKTRFRDGLGGLRQPDPADAPSMADDERTPTRAAQLRAGIDRRRKRLLLGLAAVILALGSFQAIRAFAPASEPAKDAALAAPSEATSKDVASAAAPIAAATAVDAATAADKPATEPAPRPDPQTTQSIAKPSEPAATSSPAPAASTDPAPASTKPAQPTGRKAVPRVAETGGIAGDLAGVPPGLATLKTGALEGDGAALYDLAARAAEGRGLTRDLALAAKLFGKLAAAGYAPAQYKLAGHYEKGLGVARDLDQAKLWYGRAAEQGNVRSMHNLAVIFAENPGAAGKPDFATAAQWFRRGAEHGVRDSQYNLAVLYARGLGVQQDLVQSYAWFAAAAAQGDDDAGKKRDDVAGKLPAKDLASARGLATAFKAKSADPAANEPPVAGAPAAMTLLGAPSPTASPSPRRI